MFLVLITVCVEQFYDFNFKDDFVGWSLGQHGEFAKFTNFLEATKVPLIIHIPEMNTKSVTLDDLVELVDLFPTLVDLTQVSHSLKTCENNKTAQLCTEGKSLVPMMYRAAKNKVSLNNIEIA